MIESIPAHILLNEIDALQDEVLRQLDELNLRLQRTLAEAEGREGSRESRVESLEPNKAA
jgi:hypothetical protein